MVYHVPDLGGKSKEWKWDFDAALTLVSLTLARADPALRADFQGPARAGILEAVTHGATYSTRHL